MVSYNSSRCFDETKSVSYKVPIKIQFDACNVIIIWRYVGQHVYRSFYL
jgi:hypothetical protein